MQSEKQTTVYMDGEELKRCRETLSLSRRTFACALRLPSADEAQIMLWEMGNQEVPGPVSLAVEYLLFLHVCGEPMPATYRPPAPLQEVGA